MGDFSMASMILRGLEADRRAEDGLLHCHSDLLGPLRHAQLRIAGAPMRPEGVASRVRLKTGTLWHEYVAERARLEKRQVMTEFDTQSSLPEGWGGTPDLAIWEPEPRGWALHDVKTQRSESFAYDGGRIKPEHLAQVSAYWHAMVLNGHRMVDEVTVTYVPMNALRGDKELGIEERVATPMAKDELWPMMEERAVRLRAYLASLNGKGPLTDELAPYPERVQKLYAEYEGKPKRGQPRGEPIAYTLKLMPHWLADYCPFEPPLCNCHEQGQTKIGVYTPVGTRWLYTASDKYDHIEPTLAPDGGVIRL